MIRQRVVLSCALACLAACASTNAVSVPNARLDHVVIINKIGGFTAGTSYRLLARAYDARGEELIEGVRFQWASSDTTIMLVDQDGNVFCKRSGTSTVAIEATRDGLTSRDSVVLAGIVLL